MDDYFVAERWIIDRLIDQVPELRAVEGAQSLNGVAASSRSSPMAAVIWGGETPLTGDNYRVGRGQIIDQQWMILLVVRNARNVGTGGGIRAEAGPLLIKINSALQNWKPAPGFGRLIKMATPGPRYEDGYGFFALRYSTRITMQGVEV